MEFQDKDEVLAVVQASAGRRFIGIVALGLLGALLIYMGLSQSPGFGWQVFLLAVGAGALWLATRMHQATSSHIELTPEVLRDGDGTVLARLADVEGLERGAFAFLKPSNGFLLRTTQNYPRRWRPGLWWCLVRRIGVGGMTSAQQTKFMSEIISGILASREQAD